MFFFGPSGILSWPPTQEFVGGRSHFAADGRDICLRVLERQNFWGWWKEEKKDQLFLSSAIIESCGGSMLERDGLVFLLTLSFK